MKVSCVLVVSALVLAAGTVFPAFAQTLVRVRALDDTADSALQRGLSGSLRFRALVAELEVSDLIVHLMSADALPATAVGTTQLSSAGPSHRYVRITISSDLTPDEQAAVLGHELQHACEISRSQARDSAAMRLLYRSIGQRVDSIREAYETNAAIDAGSRVWSDLHEPSPMRSRMQHK